MYNEDDELRRPIIFDTMVAGSTNDAPQSDGAAPIAAVESNLTDNGREADAAARRTTNRRRSSAREEAGVALGEESALHEGIEIYRRYRRESMMSPAVVDDETNTGSIGDDESSVDSRLDLMWEEDDNFEQLDRILSKSFDEGEGQEMDSEGFSGFHRLCNAPRRGIRDPRWDPVRDHMLKFAKSEEDAVRELLMTPQGKGRGYLPMHVVCKLCPPKDVVEDMIRMCPDCVREVTDQCDTALHLACFGLFPSASCVIELLAQEYPDARNEMNSKKRFPLHNYLSSCNAFEWDPYPRVVKVLATMKTMETRDEKDRGILHLLAKSARKLMCHNKNKTLSFLEFSSSIDDASPDSALRRIKIERNFELSLDAILTGSYRDPFLLFRDLKALPSELRNYAFTNYFVKVGLNEIMQCTSYTAILIMDIFFWAVYPLVSHFYVLSSSDIPLYLDVLGFLFILYTAIRWSLAFFTRKGKTKWLLQQPSRLLPPIFIILITLQLWFVSIPKSLSIAYIYVVWMFVLFGLRSAFKDIAIFIDGTTQIIWKIRWFAVTTFILLLMFAGVFAEIFAESEDCESPSFCTYGDSFVKVWALFIGDIDEDYFSSEQPAIFRLNMFIFSFFSTIVFLNIIIAIVTVAYESADKRAEHIFWQQRFNFFDEVDVMIKFLTCNRCTKMRNSSLEQRKELIYTSLKRRHPVIKYPIEIIWFLVGFLTAGYLWPISMRRAMFCPHILLSSDANDAEDNKIAFESLKGDNQELKAAMKKSDFALKGEIQELRRDNIKLKAAMDTHHTDMKESVFAMMECMHEIRSELSVMKSESKQSESN